MFEPAARGTQPEEVADSDQAIAWMKTEHQVLMRAITYAADNGFDAEALQLAWALTDYLDRCGHWHDWTASQRIALGAANRLGDASAQAQAHRYLGRAMFQLQDFESAFNHQSQALELQRMRGDRGGEAGANDP
jgi:hypothetical protein